MYIYNASDGNITLVTKGPSGTGGNDSSYYATISGDGSSILFVSNATDLIEDITTTYAGNLFIYNVSAGTTVLLTPGSSGNGLEPGSWSWGGDISRDGSKVTFLSNAKDVISGTTLNDNSNIFYCDVDTLATTLVTKGPDGLGGNHERQVAPGISADGKLVAFQSQSTDLIDGITLENGQNIFLYSADTDALSLVTKGPDGFGTATDQGTGNPTEVTSEYVIFSSNANNLIEGASITPDIINIYSYNIATEEIKLLTAGPDGADGNDYSYSPSVSGDGKTIGFASDATNLIDGIVTKGFNAFSYNLVTGKTTLLSAGPDGTGGDNGSNRPTLSYDGSGFAFHSNATDLIDGIAANGNVNVFIKAPDKYAVTVTGGAGGGDFIGGATVTITAGTAPSGKIFDKWTSADGVTFANANAPSTTFTMPSKAVTVVATYKDALYNITLQNDDNGTAAASSAPAAAGTEITLTATAKDGYKLKEWQVVSGGVTVTGNKFTMPQNDVTIKAIFVKDGLSGGAIAGIVIGVAAALGAAGFCIYWFIIRKKKVA